MQRVRYLFGDLIHLGIGNVHHASHIANHAAGCHRAEGDDLCHMVIAVFPANVIHHFTPAGIAEIHINIGHTHTLGVQEALKV